MVATAGGSFWSASVAVTCLLAIPVTAAYSDVGGQGSSAGGKRLEGKLRGDPQSRVTLRLHQDGRTARFSARNFQVGCEDGTFPRFSLSPLRLRIDRSGRLDGTRYHVSDDGTEEFVRVKGQLISQRRAVA